MTRRRILIPLTFLPYPPNTGARIRTWEIARRLSQEFEVTFALHLRSPVEQQVAGMIRDCGFAVVAGSVNTGVRAAARVLQETLSGGPPVCGLRRSAGLERQLCSIHEAKPFDVVQVEHSEMARYGFILPQSPKTVLSITLHDILSDAYCRMASIETRLVPRLWLQWNSRRMRPLEAKLLPQYDVCITMSERDRELVRSFAPEARTAVLPNAVDALANRMLDEAENESPVLLFVGHMRYPPNADAARWLARDIFPEVRKTYPRARLLLAGGHPSRDLAMPANAGPGVQLTGEVAELEPLYQQADIALAPLRAGGGTRLKILEAMARGRAVIATTLGAEGLDVVHGEHLLIANTPCEIARAVSELFQDAELRRRLRANARLLVEKKYSWDDCGNGHLKLYESLLARRKER